MGKITQITPLRQMVPVRQSEFGGGMCEEIERKCMTSGAGWAHELKHDGYRLQIHVRDGRVRLYTMNGADWSKRYPRIVESWARVAPNCL